jgi:hypothetical protein
MHKVVELNVKLFIKNFGDDRDAYVDESYIEMGEYFWTLVLKALLAYSCSFQVQFSAPGALPSYS